jgi:hypothetical protein
MAEFPFDGLDIEPSPVQAELIAEVRRFIADADVPEPDVIQPRPTNPGAIELFWIEQKLCVVFEDEDEIESIFGLGLPPGEAA